MAREMKIGDMVLCVKTHPRGYVIAGQEYIIDGFTCCHACGRKRVFIRGIIKIARTVCDNGHKSERERLSLGQYRFILPDLESLHQHRVNVSAKELTEIKTHQLS